MGRLKERLKEKNVTGKDTRCMTLAQLQQALEGGRFGPLLSLPIASHTSQQAQQRPLKVTKSAGGWE